MRKFLSLTKRNCLVFLRDRSAVFFSLLSMLIVIGLMVIFLGEMNVDYVTELLNQYGGPRDLIADQDNALHLIQYWTLAGIMVVNAVTVTLTVVGTMISDSSENRLESFYSSPVSRTVIALSYIAAAIAVGMLLCLLTMGVAILYIVQTGGIMLTWTAVLQSIGYLFLIVCVFSTLMFLFALFVKSSSAWSGLATIVGTLVGFAGAIYLPVANLPEGVTNVLKCLPILHGTALMRQVFCEASIAETFTNCPVELIDGYKESLGITINMSGEIVSRNFEILFMAICGIVALAVCALLIKKKNINDR